MQDFRILVTGGFGYLGSTLVPDLINRGYKVTVVDNLMYQQTSLAHLVREERFEFIKGDVRDLSLMKSVVKKADIILPLAAIVGAPACNKDPVLAKSVNFDSIIDLFKLVSENQQIIMPTTNSAYGSGDENNYCDENSPLNPLSTYALDKVAVENQLMSRNNSTSFRLATVFGISPRMRLDLLVNNFVYKAITDKYLVIFEGHFKRNYIHVSDISRAFQFGIENHDVVTGQIYNVGLSDANISKLDLCKKIAEHIPDFSFFEAKVGKDPDQRNYIVSNAKIEAAGFRPQISLDKGIDELIKGLPIFNVRYFSNI